MIFYYIAAPVCSLIYSFLSLLLLLHSSSLASTCLSYVGNYVMVRIRPEKFPQGIARKSQACSTGPFKVLKMVGSYAYLLELLPDMGISPTFNVEDLVLFRGPTILPNSPGPIVLPDPDTAQTNELNIINPQTFYLESLHRHHH